ncbi:hypothetical protein ACFE04_018589 [Oxalis oulophora]
MASLSFLLFFFFLYHFSSFKELEAHKSSLGAIVNCNSRAGREEKVAMEMAIRDFYNAHPNYEQISLHVKNSHGDFRAASSSAKNLIKENKVKAIVGLGKWQEGALVASLSNISRVPLLSIANEVPIWSSSNPYFIHAARSQFAQLKAIADIIGTYQWRKVNIIYEDIESPLFSSMIPFLIFKLQGVDAEIGDVLPLPPFSSRKSVSEELRKLRNSQYKVFIVHTSLGLGIRVFGEAKKLGMVEKESVWITTTEISNHVDDLSRLSIASMNGVVGIKSYFSKNGKRFRDFRTRFKIMFHKKYHRESNLEPGIFALQAYDAVWSIALSLHGKESNLLTRILASNFEGLTGNFSFKEGQLDAANTFRLVNIVDKSYNELGFWTKGLGFSTHVHIGKSSNYSKSMEILGQVLWPGRPLSVPRGWEVSPTGKRLKIAVPTSNTHPEFVNVTNDEQGNPIFGGYSIDVFNATLRYLPYKFQYDFSPYSGTYDQMVEQVKLEKFDAVVADTAIVANRCAYAEFTQPYSDSGLEILVYKKPSRFNKAWLFLKPFTTSMWAATAAINVYNGFVVWLIERRNRPEFRGPIRNQMGTWLALSFTTLFSIPGERMNSNSSRIAMVVWLFLALVITQSFTASLTSFLTAQESDATDIDVDKLRLSGAKVGCDASSFVVKYLETVLKFKPENIVRIQSEDEYLQRLKNGNIAAAFLEVPYVKVFLAKYCDGFTTAKQSYKVGGFGFAFPKSSPYVPDISEAILKVSETGKLLELQKSLLAASNCTTSSNSDDGHDRLGINSFQGLFLISVGTTTFSLVLFIIRQRQRNRNHIFAEAQQQHDPREDEQHMFGPEMEFLNRNL